MSLLSLDWSLQTDALGRLVFTDAHDVAHLNVRPVRLFPLTAPASWISLCSAEGAELISIEHVEQLPPDVRQLIVQALAAREFVPVIQAIHDIRHAPHGHEWHVTTDRGRTSFNVESDESIQSMGSGRFVIIDHSNTRYLIPNSALLDKKSRQRLERYY